MKLEDEIKTKQFRNQRHKLLLNIMFTYGWVMKRSQSVLHPYGITIPQHNILRILRGQFPKPCNVQLLKDRMLDQQSDVSRLVDRLAAKDLIERKTNAADRRKLDIVISETGLKLLERLEPEIYILEGENAILDEEQARQINELLDLMRDQKP
jgi:DNA-binding MarR family transcriptional regulator